MTPELLSVEIVNRVRAGLAAGESPTNLAETVKNLIEREGMKLGLSVASERTGTG